VKNLVSGARVVLKSHYGYEVRAYKISFVFKCILTVNFSCYFIYRVIINIIRNKNVFFRLMKLKLWVKTDS